MSTSNECGRLGIIPLEIFHNIPNSQGDSLDNVVMEHLEVPPESTNRQSHDMLKLFVKSQNIPIPESAQSDSQLSNSVVRLGAFHVLMSYLGCIGYVMGGNGLKELLNTINAQLSLDKMLQGHAFSRAVRGHLLVQTALSNIIFGQVQVTVEEQTFIDGLMNDFPSKSPTLDSLKENPYSILLATNDMVKTTHSVHHLEAYIKNVKSHYPGRSCCVIFDGYTNSLNSTKTAEQEQRYRMKKSPDINLNLNTEITVKQDHFLSNEHNKSRLITLLKSQLNENGIESRQTPGDADLLIVASAIDKSNHWTNPPLLSSEEITYHQVQQWLGNELSPELWGWARIPGNHLAPVHAEDPVAPEEILKMIFCRCTKDCSIPEMLPRLSQLSRELSELQTRKGG
ncbi:hypothetical protein PR048_030037 [Dryococelus australis]|uniref:Uncharacterized protein n=1 Tax=Dryococelus australis TaxID=614101 RepID=A0ABQ9G7T4_9NEOP|nr:hypothetical protein PR048_030037 [Dryococelus australis]